MPARELLFRLGCRSIGMPKIQTRGKPMKRPTMAAMALLLGLGLPAGAADAAEIKVLSTGNMQSILGALTPDFESATGYKLVIEYGSTPKMKSRVESGEAA